MPVDIVIPNVGESVTNGVISVWRKKDGERVERDTFRADVGGDGVDHVGAEAEFDGRETGLGVLGV